MEENLAEEVKPHLGIVTMDHVRSTVYGRTLAHGVNVVRLAGSGLKNVNDSLRLRRKDPMESLV